MMKGSFDGVSWYQFKWNDVEFRDFETISNECNDINELNARILEAFPHSQFEYEYIGDRKAKKVSAPKEETPKKRKKKKA